MANLAQKIFMSLGFETKKKIRAREFLKEMDNIIPYSRIIAKIKHKYESKATTGRKKYNLKLMLKIYLLQQFYELGDLAVEEAIYDRISFQEFLDIDTLSSNVPDETTILNFRHFLEENGLQDLFFEEVLALLKEKGLFFQRGTIVDATIIKSSSSTKNKDKKRDPEMSSTKKNNNYYFGMKTHIGVDSDSGIVHKVHSTKAKNSDIGEMPNLFHGQEKAIFGDKAYTKYDDKQKARKSNIFYGILDKATRRKRLSKKQKQRNATLSSIRSKVEHPFRILKCQFNFQKTRFKGIYKNHVSIVMKLALGNLYLMRNKILQA